MKCPDCDWEAREGSRFCPGCGAPFSPSEASVPRADEQSAAARHEETQPLKEVEASPAGPEKRKRAAATAKTAKAEKRPPGLGRKTKKWPIAVAILVAIALIGTGVGVYFVWIRDGEGKGSDKFGYETREYGVKVEIPEGTPLDLNKTRLAYGMDGFTDIDEARDTEAEASVFMSDGATGLITLQNRETEEDILYGVYPKDEDYLVEYEPVVDTLSTAQSLVFLQPGVAISDPVLARLTLELLKSLPEVKDLADYIAENMQETPAFVSSGDAGLVERVSNAYGAFFRLLSENTSADMGGEAAARKENQASASLTRQGSKAGWPAAMPVGAVFPQETAPVMSEVYPQTIPAGRVPLKDEDLGSYGHISVELRYDPSTSEGVFKFTNYSTWPGIAVLKKGKDLSSVNTGDFVTFWNVGAVPFELSTVSDVVFNAVISLGLSLKDILKGDFDIGEHWKDVFGDINKTEWVTEGSFTFEEGGEYSLFVYVPGWGKGGDIEIDQSQVDNAWQELDMGKSVDLNPIFNIVPYVMKVCDEGMQILSIIVDIRSFGDIFKTGKVTSKIHQGYMRSSELADELGKEILQQTIPRLPGLIEAIKNEDKAAIIRAAFEIMVEFGADAKFWQFICRHYFLERFPDLITKKFSDKMISAVSKLAGKKIIGLSILAWLKIADAVAVLVGEGCRIYLWLNDGSLFGPRDEFSFEIETSGGTSPPAPATAGSDTVFVMDVSGSMGDAMEGQNKLYHARMAASDLVGTIKNESLTGGVTHAVGLVTFTDGASINSGLSSNYASLQSAIGALTPQNSTNMEDGINKGISVLRNARPGSKKIMVLLSDGLPNVGASSLEDLLAGCVDAAKREGIVINTVGFGNDCDENLLKGIADYTGGSYAYASSSFALSSVYIKIRHEAMGSVIYTEEDTISSGSGTRRKTFQVGGGVGEINGTVNWRGASVLDFRLYDPRGRRVDSSYAGASLFKDRNPMQFIIKNPVQGTWTLEIVVAGSSSVPRAPALAGARVGKAGPFAAAVYAQAEEEADEGEQGDTEFQVVISARGEEEEPTVYPLVLWIVLGASALLALALFLLLNRRISPPLRGE